MKTRTITSRLFLVGLCALSMACSSDDDFTPEVPQDPVEENPDEETPSDEGITIADLVLRNEVKAQLGIADSDPITAEDMLELTELRIEGINAFEMESLSGLEYAENLTYLRFGETSVTDLSPIADLTKVEYLRFNDTEISDLSPLSNYTSLTYFNANTARNITDISPLAGNTGLQEIILRNVPMGNEGMETVAGFTNLYRINMRNTGVTDLTVLGQLMEQGALQNDTPGAVENQGGAVIDVRELEVTDWRPIAGYVADIYEFDGPAFEELNLENPALEAHIKTALELGENVQLNTLYLLSLTELDMEGDMELTSLQGLEYAENLTHLRFGETSVTDLEPISDLEHVEYLRLDRTEVSDLSPLSGYTSLTYFNANRTTTITDISPLAGNTGIKEIILREIPFGNAGMETIANFTEMYRINMRGTGVTDISVLAELMEQGALLDTTPGAEENGGADLDLRDLEVDDWTPIEAYSNQITTLEY